MNVRGIIVEQIEWDGTLKSLTMQPDQGLGDLWVAFPDDYSDSRSGPFHFQNEEYEKLFSKNAAKCKVRKIGSGDFLSNNGIYTFKTRYSNIPTDNMFLTYYALYLPEYAVPISVNLFDSIKKDNKYRRTVFKDDLTHRYIIYLKCASQYGKFNFDLECSFKGDKDGFTQSNYSDEYQTGLYSNPDDWQHYMKPEDRERTQNFFAEQININEGGNIGKITNTKGMPEKKSKYGFLKWVPLAGLILTLIILLIGNNLTGYDPKGNQKQLGSDTVLAKQLKLKDTILGSNTLPYLENVPIIDKGIFIKYNFNDLLIGGANIDTIALGARTKEGESLKINKDRDGIKMDINKYPLVEFEYKGSYYSIETSGDYLVVNYILRKNIQPTLKLRKYKEL